MRIFNTRTNATEAPMKVNILNGRGYPPQPPPVRFPGPVWLMYFTELKNSDIVHKYLHRNMHSQAYVLQNIKSGIYLRWKRYDLRDITLFGA